MSSNPGSQNFLTELMDQLNGSILAGADRILPDAIWILTTLATIELALAFMLNRDQDPIMLFVQKCIKFSFFYWLVGNWATGMNLTKQTFDMFQNFGIKAALGSGASGITDPSYIFDIGMGLVMNLLNSIMQISTASGVMGNLVIMGVKTVILFIVIACFGWMAIQLFMTCLEFSMTSTLTVVLIPFSINKHTSFIGEKAIGAVLSFCMKIMALQFILCIVIPITETWTLEIVNTDLTPIFRAVFGCLAVAFLSWKAPEYAQGLLSGSPSLHGGDALGGARAMAGAAVGGAIGAAAGGMRIAGFSQAAMNAPGGRNNDGNANWGGAARNMGTMFRQSLPDRASEMHGKRLFDNAKTLANRRNKPKN